MTVVDQHAATPTARRAFAVNAGVAWTGIVLTVLISALGWYAAADTAPEPGLYGDTPEGTAGALARLSDTLSYFTVWSNVVVAVSLTLLARAPERDTMLRRVLRLDALLMITVTAIVYQVLLAPEIELQGWSWVTDPLLHVVTPVLTLLVWVVWGPRGWITGLLVPAALAVPLLWTLWMLARGAIIDAYPYGFVNVVDLGYASVGLNLLVIVAFGLLVATAYWGLDVWLRRRRA